MSILVKLDLTDMRNWPQMKTEVDNCIHINMGKVFRASYLALLCNGIKAGGKVTLGNWSGSDSQL